MQIITLPMCMDSQQANHSQADYVSDRVVPNVGRARLW